jgi:predicted CoA-binding protein
MKANLKQIQDFLSNKHLAFIGASRNPKKFGTEVFNQLLKLDYELLPIHPEAETIEGIACLRSIDELPTDVKAICLLTPKDKTDHLLKQALEAGMEHIWIQQFSEGPETFNMVRESKANVVTGRCLFMYTKPEGFHKFHERMAKLFRVYAS